MTDRLLALLQENAATVATAESLTGGRLAAAVTAIPGASTVFRGGVVAYATDLKESLLGVPREVVAGAGVISAACAEAMAIGVRQRCGATYGLATTGVAGPDEQEGQAVGTVYVGLADATGVRSVRLSLTGSRADIQDTTVAAALELLVDHLRE